MKVQQVVVMSVCINVETAALRPAASPINFDPSLVAYGLN